MGLLEALFPRVHQEKELKNWWQTLTAYQPSFHSWNGQLYESELVRSAIDSRARHISKLRIEIIGSAKPTLQTQLKKQPNQWQTWSQFLYRLSTLLDMNNTAFIFPVLNRSMEVVGVYTGNVTEWKLLQDEKNTPWIKVTFNNQKIAVYKLSEIGIMTKFQFRDDFFGELNTALDDTMKLIDIQNQGIGEAIKNSATYRFMAQSSNFAKAEDLAKERRRFSSVNLSSNGGGLLLFPNTYNNIQQIKASPYVVDSEQRDLIQKNVFNYFGVNDDILQNKAIGDSWNAFYEGCVEVFSIQFSEVITKMLFTEVERAYGAEIMATANRMQYLSNSDKLNVSAQMADRGILTRNEIREIWNLPPIPNGDVATIRGEYYLFNEDGTTTKHEDDVTGGNKDE